MIWTRENVSTLDKKCSSSGVSGFCPANCLPFCVALHEECAPGSTLETPLGDVISVVVVVVVVVVLVAVRGCVCCWFLTACVRASPGLIDSDKGFVCAWEPQSPIVGGGQAGTSRPVTRPRQPTIRFTT